MKFHRRAAVALIALSFFAAHAWAQEAERRVETKDTNNDGKVDQWITWEGARPVHFESDRNGDGKPDVWADYTYTPAKEKGKPDDKNTLLSADRNNDGKPDYWKTERNGMTLEQWGDLNFDGKIDVTSYYAENNRKRWLVIDKNFDGKIDAWFYYGEKGEGTSDPQMPGVVKPTAIDVDEDFDGKPDRTFGSMPTQRPPLKTNS